MKFFSQHQEIAEKVNRDFQVKEFTKMAEGFTLCLFFHIYQ